MWSALSITTHHEPPTKRYVVKVNEFSCDYGDFALSSPFLIADKGVI